MGCKIIRFPEGCVCGKFVKREKRFFVAVEIDGSIIWAHTNNTGTMKGLLYPGVPVLVSPAKDPKRKLKWTVELIWTEGEAYNPNLSSYSDMTDSYFEDKGFWVGVNTGLPNKIFVQAFYAGLFPWAKEYSLCRTEVKKGESRIDVCLEEQGLPRLWVECKNVTLVDQGKALFPDAVSVRGLKHLNELKAIVDGGERAAMFYCIQRQDAQLFAPATEIDPLYAQAFWVAQREGVEVYPYQIRVCKEGISVGERLPVDIFME